MKPMPYGHQWIDRKDIEGVVRVLRSDWLTQGPKVKEFEDALCRYTGSRYAVAVSSGTGGLHIACLAAGIGGGDEVITSPMTFAASANCAIYCGARPVFADVREDTVNIDPNEIEKNLSKKTAAVIPVHFAGHPCDMEALAGIAGKNRLIVIEDAAHALGAEYKDSKIGSCRYSDMTVFSFHPVKTITTGEGGAVLTNNERLYKKLLLLRTHGIERIDFKDKSAGPWYYEVQCLGFNYRMSDIQAALGISQLKKVDSFIENRRDIAEAYDRAFKDNGCFDLPKESPGCRSSYHLYFLRLRSGYKAKRWEIFSRLRRRGLGVQVHYIPVYTHPYYKRLGYKRRLCRRAEDLYERLISIPIYPAMTKGDIGHVVKTVLDVFKNIAGRRS